MIACYCRVSTRHQKNDSQRAEIGRWLKGNGTSPDAVRWFEDKESGTSLIRPSFEELQRAIFNGDVKTVIVWASSLYLIARASGVELLLK